MFNPLKGLGDLNELRKQAMQLQAALKQIVVTSEKGRAYVELTADMKIQSVKVNGEERGEPSLPCFPASRRSATSGYRPRTQDGSTTNRRAVPTHRAYTYGLRGA